MNIKIVKYPHTRIVDHVDVIHGVKVSDPYRWLEEIDSVETQEWILAQNELTFDYLKNISTREKIRKRMTELWDYEKFGVPVKKGGMYFFTFNTGLWNQNKQYYMNILNDELKLLIDPNTLSKDGTIALANTSVSKDGRLMAYGLSESGSDWQEWHVMEIESGEKLDDHLKWIKFTGASWTSDSKGFFYTRYPPQVGDTYKAANTDQKLYYHIVGSLQSNDKLVYERPDQPEWRFMPSVDEDGKYLLLSISEGRRHENLIYYIELEKDWIMKELISQWNAKYSYISNIGSKVYLMTDNDAPHSRVIAIDLKNPKKIVEIIPESEDILRSVSVSNNKIIATYLHDALPLVKVYGMEGNHLSDVELPGLGSVTGFRGKLTDTETFYSYSNYTNPGTIYKYDMETGKSTIFRKPELIFYPEDYETKQIFYNSKDGTKVPMFITYKKGLTLDGKNPCYLSGYGGFNIPLSPRFSVRNLVFLEMGGVTASPNLRGGGEYGKEWHEAGTKTLKQNVFDDFIAAAEYLIEHKYTSTPKLAISGRSNGGLLAGACLIQRPDLFGCTLPIVGVLDMIRFHKFTVGSGWVSDYGSAEDPEQFKALLAYSPYHNVVEGTKYPPTLVTTGDHDDRVFPAHTYKFAAALQHAQSGENPVILRVDLKSGHGGGKPVAKQIEEFTDELAFIVKHLDIKE